MAAVEQMLLAVVCAVRSVCRHPAYTVPGPLRGKADLDRAQDEQNGTSDERQRWFHPRAEHGEVTVVQKGHDDNKTEELVAEIFHLARESGVYDEGRQAGDDGADQVPGEPAGKEPTDAGDGRLHHAGHAGFV